MLDSSSRRIFLLILAVCIVFGVSATEVTDPSSLHPRHEDDVPADMPTPDSHSHSHKWEPLFEFKDPEDAGAVSYWAHDFKSGSNGASSSESWRGLMGLHVAGMVFAFFVLLPVGISLRSVRHRWHSASVVAFNIVALLSSAAGSLYKKLTGDLYTGSVHGKGGFLVLTLVAILTACDALGFFQRALLFFRGSDRRNYRLFWRSVVLNQAGELSPEYARLFPEELEEHAEAERTNERTPEQAHFLGRNDTSSKRSFESDEWIQSTSSHRPFTNVPLHGRWQSMASHHSEETLHNPSPIMREDPQGRRQSLLSRVGHIAFATAERSLVILAFEQVLTGFVVYGGICREGYINQCLAHLIKGGIFWCYGLLTFGRYLGAWADVGWAWNRIPARSAKSIPTAEAVESLVIFLYGASNVWMERFGVAPGSPFTTRQIQHISIAAMFWFAGMLGLALESTTFRNWLSSPAKSAIKPDEQLTQPPSYSGSFNPFPALVIGVTGAAMSAHHQTYIFQVQIHALWGFYLTGFAAFRCFTYFFLWLRPPHSVLPSRPPTEVLASFFLAAGGLTFIFSTEQITFAAMRRQMDDMMFFLNLSVTMTCIAFCWLLSIIAFKGWVNYRARLSALTPLSHNKVLFEAHVA